MIDDRLPKAAIAHTRIAGDWLLTDFGFAEPAAASNPGLTQIVFQRLDWFVDVTIERRDQTVFIDVGRIVGGAIPPIQIQPPDDPAAFTRVSLRSVLNAAGVSPSRRDFGTYVADRPAAIGAAIDESMALLRAVAPALFVEDRALFLAAAADVVRRTRSQGDRVGRCG